jgi:hypothetical protein
MLSGLKGLGFAMQGKLHHVEQRKTYCEGCFILEWDLKQQLHKDEGRIEASCTV